MKNITHLFFDLDHTLWDTDKNAYESLNELHKEIKLNELHNITFELFHSTYQKHNDALWKKYAQHEVTKEDVRINRFKFTLEELGVFDNQKNDFFASHFVRRTPLKKNLIDGAINLMEAIKDNYTLSIITNGFKEVQYIKMEHSGLSKYFEHIFISEEVGYNKPNPNIFNHAMQISGASNPSNCLMIGDSLEADIHGSIGAQMNAIHLDLKNMQSLTRNDSYVVVNSLEQIQLLLKK
ncbi:MAG: YjjG family noncanonical pyrimidine nucleotidase [Bacteroidota bacterium]